MNLNITLKDPKYCDGCPCLSSECQYYKEKIILYNWKYLVRLPKCIQENGI